MRRIQASTNHFFKTLLYFGMLILINVFSFSFSSNNYEKILQYRESFFTYFKLPLNVFNILSMQATYLSSEESILALKSRKIELIAINSEIISNTKLSQSLFKTNKFLYDFNLNKFKIITIKPRYYSSNGFLSDVIFTATEEFKDQVLPNMAVISESGLYGRIASIKGDLINIISIFSVFSKIPVYTKTSRIYGMAAGDGFKARFLYPNLEVANIIDGEEVYTSGENDLIIANVPFGIIKKLENEIIIIPFSSSRPEVLGIILK